MAKNRMFVGLLATLAVVMGLTFAPSAFASTATPNVLTARGQCGGGVSSFGQYMNNLAVFGAVQQAANVNRSAGYSPRDGSFAQWGRDRVIVTRLAAPAVVDNYGCNARGLFYAGKKRLPKGWPVLVALPAMYSKSDVRTKAARGFKAVIVKARLVGQASCTNPGKAIVKVVIFVKVKPKPKPPPKGQPPAPPNAGICNVTITGVVTGNVINCSTFIINITCNGGQITIIGTNVQEVMDKVNAQVCVAPPTQAPPPPSPPAPQPPPPSPPAPPARSCLILPVEGKDGMFFSVTVAVSDPSAGPQGTISWGDGASSPGLQGEHTYSTEGTFTISASVNFQQGGSAACSTQVVVRRKSAPSPP